MKGKASIKLALELMTAAPRRAPVQAATCDPVNPWLPLSGTAQDAARTRGGYGPAPPPHQPKMHSTRCPSGRQAIAAAAAPLPVARPPAVGQSSTEFLRKAPVYWKETAVCVKTEAKI